MKRTPLMDNKHIYYCNINFADELSLIDEIDDLESLGIYHIIRVKYIHNKGKITQKEMFKYCNAFDEKTQKKVLKVYEDFIDKTSLNKFIKTIIEKSEKAKQSVSKRLSNEQSNDVTNDTTNEQSNDVSKEKEKEKEKVNNEEIEKRFNAIWSYYKIPAKGKGLKNKALSSFINKKVNKRSGEDIKLVIDAELKKEVGQRHLVTIFNNFEDSLEMARDIILEVKATKLKPTRLV